jgi:tricorn protease
MKRTCIYLLTVLIMITVNNRLLSGINRTDTRMMSQPAICKTHIAFIYAEDLWVANLDGSNPVRLTIDEGIESNPSFSPDGKLIAFSAQYDGNTDVYVIPADGGIPKRLTWHPGDDYVRGFTPDGANVLFISQRSVFTDRFTQFFVVPVNGGYPTRLEIPNGYSASYSPDGQSLAYTPLAPASNQWKNYRGGRISNIWLYSFSDNSVVKIPQPKEGCNDSYPIWIGNKIFFISDRNGEFNLFSFDYTTNEILQLTDYSDFPILNASEGDEKIVFEQAGYLHIYDLKSNSVRRLSIGIATDLLELRPRYINGNKYVRSVDISPSGSRVVFDFRGEIITLPAEKGDPRNITITPGVHETNPSWSPDGKIIAFFSDESGEIMLHLKSQDGSGMVKSFKLDGTGFYAFPKWSPDSKKICYTDNGRNLYIIDLESNLTRKIDTDGLYVPGSFRYMFGDWSSDSKWITYTKMLETNFKIVCLYSLDQQKSFPVTDGLSNASDPKFDANGEYLYLFASTDAGPVVNWFDLSNMDMRMTNVIYLVTLRKDIESPLAKESDEENIKEETTEPERSSAKTKRVSKDQSSSQTKPELLVIETSGIQDRIISLPVKPGNYTDLGVADTGEVIYIIRPSNSSESSKL